MKKLFCNDYYKYENKNIYIYIRVEIHIPCQLIRNTNTLKDYLIYFLFLNINIYIFYYSTYSNLIHLF